MRDMLAERLIDLFENSATEEWPWFEEYLTYSNAKLPHALIAVARSSGNSRALEIGLKALRWIVKSRNPLPACFDLSVPMAFISKGNGGPNSTSNHLKPKARSQPALLLITRPTIPPGFMKHALPSNGFSEEMTSALKFTTRKQAAAGTDSKKIVSTRIKGPNRLLRSSSHSAR